MMLGGDHYDLFQFVPKPIVPVWKPTVVDKENWPPDYIGVYGWRTKQIKWIRERPERLIGAKKYYSTHKAEFIMHWCDTFDPRKPAGRKWIPFIFFPKQYEFFQFIESCVADSENGLVEKARDMGATWLCVGWCVATWLFDDYSTIGWGSRKEWLVDKLGVPDSIFEKMRLMLKRIPKDFKPKDSDLAFMRLLNGDNGAVITGEAGDNIGRGGRNTVYYKDESAHYEHPELIEAALGDNTNVQIDISSVNGLGNVFNRKREAGVEWHPGSNCEPGVTRVFIFDWRDHPEKTQEWYDLRKKSMEAQGLSHVFAQEVDRNYSAAISNTIIPQEWIRAAIDADKKLGIPDDGPFGGALDVGEDGGDRNALVMRRGISLRYAEEWGSRDIGVTTRKAIGIVRPFAPLSVQYDSVGMGSTVKAEFNRLTISPDGIEKPILDGNLVRFVPWNAGARVQNPWDRIIPDDLDSLVNRDYFGNMKAQAWWNLRLRFWRTFQAVTMNIKYDFDTLISLDGTIPLLLQIVKELSQPTMDKNQAMKMIVEKKPDGTRSPNIADAIVMCYFPAEDNFASAQFGLVGNE